MALDLALGRTSGVVRQESRSSGSGAWGGQLSLENAVPITVTFDRQMGCYFVGGLPRGLRFVTWLFLNLFALILKCFVVSFP